MLEGLNTSGASLGVGLDSLLLVGDVRETEDGKLKLNLSSNLIDPTSPGG